MRNLEGENMLGFFSFPLFRLKERMRDLDKPLRIVNRTLWEELSGYTEDEVCRRPLCSFSPHLLGHGNVANSLQLVCCHSSNCLALNLKRETTSSEEQARFGVMR